MDSSYVQAQYKKLKNELFDYPLNGYLSIEHLKVCIKICDKYILDLREYINKVGFESLEQEILFFKELKPRFLHRHYFYVYLLHLEIDMPLQDIDEIIPYLKNLKKKIHTFHHENRSFAKYLRLNKSIYDEIYFTRQPKRPWESDLHYQSKDPLFYCLQDDIIKQIKANKSILKFIDNKIKLLQGAFLPLDKTLKWNSTKVALIELSYGIWCTNACNADILTISSALGTLFNIDTSDCYRIFNDIKSRKIEPTKFIKKMDKSLLKYIEQAK